MSSFTTVWVEKPNEKLTILNINTLRIYCIDIDVGAADALLDRTGATVP